MSESTIISGLSKNNNTSSSVDSKFKPATLNSEKLNSSEQRLSGKNLTEERSSSVLKPSRKVPPNKTVQTNKKSPLLEKNTAVSNPADQLSHSQSTSAANANSEIRLKSEEILKNTAAIDALNKELNELKAAKKTQLQLLSEGLYTMVNPGNIFKEIQKLSNVIRNKAMNGRFLSVRGDAMSSMLEIANNGLQANAAGELIDYQMKLFCLMYKDTSLKTLNSVGKEIGKIESRQQLIALNLQYLNLRNQQLETPGQSINFAALKKLVDNFNGYYKANMQSNFEGHKERVKQCLFALINSGAVQFLPSNDIRRNYKDESGSEMAILVLKENLEYIIGLDASSGKKSTNIGTLEKILTDLKNDKLSKEYEACATINTDEAIAYANLIDMVMRKIVSLEGNINFQQEHLSEISNLKEKIETLIYGSTAEPGTSNSPTVPQIKTPPIKSAI
ncbi:MAG: hypothetical protein LBI56_03990 [Puniceicoccales bacterium]|nr:hypothetical protein [Puniceicoccales bacterium]